MKDVDLGIGNRCISPGGPKRPGCVDQQFMTDSTATPDPSVHLRFASEADVGLILEFIKALADYERLSHEVVADN